MMAEIRYRVHWFAQIREIDVCDMDTLACLLIASNAKQPIEIQISKYCPANWKFIIFNALANYMH